MQARTERQSTENDAAPRTRWRTAAIVAVLLVVGVIAGSKLGASLTAGDTYRAAPDNPTRLQIGERLKLEDICPGNDAASSRLVELARDHKLLLCFVTNGCGPCQQYVDLLATQHVLPDDRYRLVLLSTTPEVFSSQTDLLSLPVSETFLEAGQIYQFPMTVGVDRGGRVALILPGFMPGLSARFISRHF
ncbi:hypothetical protein GF420_12465 [candidate division GN15 bacterium]|nr:hypothetical protein [candidate division GN15 bacterium]